MSIDSVPVVARTLPEPLRGLRSGAAATPALIAVAIFVALAATDGGYFETSFLPAALLILGLLVTALVSVSTSAPVPRAALIAAALFGAYAGWSYLSILWAGDQGAAWEGANRALMYGLVFALFALWRLPSGAASVVLGAIGFGIAGLGLVTLLRAGAAADVSEMFVYGRFAEPVGYTNGNAALWFLGFLPCIFLAARRELWAPVRGLALGGACLLAGLSLLAQSRGWLAAVPVVLVIFFALVPGRVRHAVALAVVAAATAAALAPILSVLEDARAGVDLEPLIASAADAILLAAAVASVAATAVALLDRAIEPGPSAAHRARAIGGTVLVLGALAAGVTLVAATGDPIATASDAWGDFRSGTDPESGQSSRFTSTGGQHRFDYWTVGLAQFADSPFLGGGTGNFQNAYLREGDTGQRPRFPHSLEVRLLSETGLVGTLLFLAAVVAALLAAVRALRSSALPAVERAAAGTAVATFAYWVVHGSVDWLYELPALGATAFALLGLAASLAPRSRSPGALERHPPRSLVRGALRRAAMAVAAIAGAMALALPWLSQLEVNRAIETWEDDPGAAFDRLDRAAHLDPLSIDPHSAAAAIAVRLGLADVAQEKFEAVLERDPDDAYSTLQLAALASASSRRDEALTLLRRARELSPRDTLVEEALRSARAGSRLDPDDVYEAALERRSSLGRSQ